MVRACMSRDYLWISVSIFKILALLGLFLPYYGKWMSTSKNARAVCLNVHGGSDYGMNKVRVCMSRDYLWIPVSIFKILALMDE